MENNLYVCLQISYSMKIENIKCDMMRVRVDALKILLGQIYVLTIEIKRKIYFLVDK